MARLPRLNLPGVPQHVIQRGNNRQAVFFSDEDYTVYLEKLKDYAEKFQVAVHAFVLMTNHVHLLVTPRTEKGVSQLMQSLGRGYVRHVNQRYQRSGTLWEGRYKSTLVDEEGYFLLVSRYIELNPVRAGMVAHPRQYRWSSYRGNALGEDIGLLTPHPCHALLGDDAASRCAAYRALFRGKFPAKALEDIRHATNSGWVLGHDRFKHQIEAATHRRGTPNPRGGDRKSRAYQEKHKIKSL